MGKKYLVLCNRHNSLYGDNWALFWGCRDSENSYSADLRLAHRFDESEINRFDDNDDIPLSIDVLGIPEECENEETFNDNIRVLIEKGTINQLFGLELKQLNFDENLEGKIPCKQCGSYEYEDDLIDGMCEDCILEEDYLL